MDFIADLKTRPYEDTRVGRRVIVIGAGNTAIDAVTQATRIGAEDETIVYRRGETDMKCYDYEYELAEQDGCGFRFHTTPVRVLGTDSVEGLEATTPHGREVIPCDMVITALVQRPKPGFALPVDDPRVFVGGDFANHGAEIVNAAAEGMEAARRIDAMLGGERGAGSGEKETE